MTYFGGDNKNPNFGGEKRHDQNNIIFSLLKDRVNAQLLGIGCPAYVLYNVTHRGLDQFGLFNIDSIFLKVFNFFSIYMVCISDLQDFCNFVGITSME